MLNFIRNKTDKFFAINMMIALCIIAFHRIDVTFTAKSIYTELKEISFPEMLSYSMGDDILALIICGIVLFLLSIFSAKVTLSRIASSAFLCSIHIFYTMSGNFFRTYETAFSTKYLSDEISTGVAEILKSALSETPAYIFIILLLGMTLIVSANFLMGKVSGSAFAMGGINRKIGALVIIIFMTSPYMFRLQALSGIDEQEKSKKELLVNITANPLINVLMRGGSMEEAVTTTGLNSEFSFGLNTDSIVNSSIQPRINSIPRGKKYNIIFYFFESTPTKYFNMKINGKDVMPGWHRLMKNSISAMNHYANYPLSANAMLSLLASAYSHYSKDLVIQKYSSIKLNSLPQILKKNGYRTALVHTGDLRYAGQRRFLGYRSIDRIIDLPELENIPPFNFKVGWGVDERAMIQPSIDFMKKSDKPFFITYMPCNPHHPYAIPDDVTPIVDPSTGKTARERMFLKYLNSLHYADFALGRLIDRLEKEGLMENTILFLMADHGEAFYQHRQNYNHPFFLYEENVHVPMLIYNKKLITSAKEIEGITRHIDLPATVLDILGIAQDSKYEGKSILSAKREQLALLHTSYRDDILGIRDGDWKYTRDMGTGKEELFNLRTDPDEKTNLVQDKKELALKFRNYVENSRKYNIEYYRRLLPNK